jgi:hypothetical protein
MRWHASTARVKMKNMNERSYLPDSNRIGVLTSTVLLALALARVIQSPEFDLELQLPGFFLSHPAEYSYYHEPAHRRAHRHRHGLAPARASLPQRQVYLSMVDPAHTNHARHQRPAIPAPRWNALVGSALRP